MTAEQQGLMHVICGLEKQIKHLKTLVANMAEESQDPEAPKQMNVFDAQKETRVTKEQLDTKPLVVDSEPPTLEELRAVMVKKLGDVGQSGIQEILQSVGGSKFLTDVDESKYGAVKHALLS